MAVAKRMVRELKGKEQAIRWGIHRNEKKEASKISIAQDKENREYDEIIRRQFLEFISAKKTEDAILKSIWNKEYAIEKRIARLKQLTEDRAKVIECFRTSILEGQWQKHLHEEEISRQHVLRQAFLERLMDERAFKLEMAAIEKIVEFEERKRRRVKDVEFEQFQVLKEQEEVMRNIELLMKCYENK